MLNLLMIEHKPLSDPYVERNAQLKASTSLGEKFKLEGLNDGAEDWRFQI